MYHKIWLDVRWRALIGLAVLAVSACGTVASRGALQDVSVHLQPSATSGNGLIGKAIAEAIDTQRTYRGYVWYQAFNQNLVYIGTLVAALLGSGSPLSGSGRGVLFSLALPASRARWLGARAAVCLGALLGLTLLPSLVFPLLSPLVGEQFAVGDALVRAVCAFAASGVVFAFALLLSTVFNDVWRPFLVTCLAALLLGTAELVLLRGRGLFGLMSAAQYFRDGSFPWLGLLSSAALAAALLYAASANLARRDF